MERKRILLIDPSDVRRQLISIFLDELPVDIEVLESSSPEDVTEFLAHHQVDLVVSELYFGRGKKSIHEYSNMQQIIEMLKKAGLPPLILYTTLFHNQMFFKEIRDTEELTIILNIEDNIDQFLTAVARALSISPDDDTPADASV